MEPRPVVRVLLRLTPLSCASPYDPPYSRDSVPAIGAASSRRLTAD